MRRRGITNNLDEHLEWLQKSRANIPPKREKGPTVSRSPTVPQRPPQEQQQQQQQRPPEQATVNPPPAPAPQLGQRQGGGLQRQGPTLVLSGQARAGIVRENSDPKPTIAAAPPRSNSISSAPAVVPNRSV